MSVLERHELERSPLADLHALASELGLEGYRRLRKQELIDAILAGAGSAPEPAPVEPDPVGAAPEAAEVRAAELETGEPPAQTIAAEPELLEEEGGPASPAESAELEIVEAEPEVAADEAPGVALAEEVSEPALTEEAPEPALVEEEPEPVEEGLEPDIVEEEPEPEVRSGVLDIRSNGNGFVRGASLVQSDEDVYVSPAQIRRCELRTGDELSGPLRPPRRSERHPSVARIDSVNGRAAEPPEERPWFHELTPVFATHRLPAPEALDVPFGKGSRVAIAGPPGAGATELLRRIVATLADREPELSLTVVLAGARPEEVTGWRRESPAPVVGGGFDRSLDEQAEAAELATERAKRAVERGHDAALVVDSLAAFPPATARRVFGAARNTEEAGSLTVIASTGLGEEPLRLATTRIVLEPAKRGVSPPSVGEESATLRAELLA